MTTAEKKQHLMHKIVPYFEAAPCYPLEEVLELQRMQNELRSLNDEAAAEEFLSKMEEIASELSKIDISEKKILLWERENMPSTGQYTENPGERFNHDPDFAPYLLEILVPQEVQPKGAIVVCAGGDHGDCTLHEGFQTCRNMVKQGYQCFLLLNRTNMCPFTATEAGADASRAIRYVRKNAVKYRIDPNRVAFAGFSNGGLTAEACIQYYSGTQKVTDHFPSYVPDELDNYYGAPDAVICVYGPRFKGASFDYTNVVYPPTFFAVGREDSAMDNLNATLPDLMANHVVTEVHTFAGVPHGQSGIPIYGVNPYPHFELWVQLADAFLQNVYSKSIVTRVPGSLDNRELRYDAFGNGAVLHGKKKNNLPAMGWNSWNAFGSGNTESLSKQMADAIVELELDKLGYQYIVLDDGCYKPCRVDGKLSNEERKFGEGFKALSDYIHGKGLKFGMYNDIGTNLCAGAAVGTCGHELTDAQSYIDWGVDFIKVDNCYYLFDNATFSASTNAKYVYAPNIKSIVIKGTGFEQALSAVQDAEITGCGAYIKDDYVTNIGTYDGTGPEPTPVGDKSSELTFKVNAPEAGLYTITVEYATGAVPEIGSWLQIAVGPVGNSDLFYDDFLSATPSTTEFQFSKEIKITLQAGENIVRLMNHRRQENTLYAYASLLEGLKKAAPEKDILFSICEWGKTQPQNWGYKVGDSWRILNDITFRVGSDGDPGYGSWTDGYTPSVTSQYNKAVIMDEFAGLDKGWNDPDMLMVGMNGLTETMAKTHMTMWCMMNSPLMLGLDLRRVKKGDSFYRIIANKELIALNQDSLGIQAKRVFSTKASEKPDTTYVRDNDRADILAKPLADGSIAVSFINISETNPAENLSVSIDEILTYIGPKMINSDAFSRASSFVVTDLWSGETKNCGRTISADTLAPCDNYTVKVSLK